MNPLASDQGLAILGAILSAGMAAGGFFLGYWRHKSGSHSPAHGWTAVDKKLGAVLGRLGKLEDLPAKFEELLTLTRDEKSGLAVQAERQNAHFEDTREIKRRLERLP